MEKYSFKEYAPSLSAKPTAKAIFEQIWALGPQENVIEIDLSGMSAMTTSCARVIFGGLYLKLGKELFRRNIRLVGYSETIRIVINWGIESAIDQNNA